MIALEKTGAHLLTLELEQPAEVLQNCLDAAGGQKPTYAEFLVNLLDAEVAARLQRYLVTSLAYFPFHKTLEGFACQPSIDESQVSELAQLALCAGERQRDAPGPAQRGQEPSGSSPGQRSDQGVAMAPTSRRPTPWSRTLGGRTRSGAWKGACASTLLHGC